MTSSISRDLPLEHYSDQPLGVAETEELPAGSQLGNYIIQECIGRGAMASVYRAEHCLLNKQVALKVMAPALLASTEARQRFLREARAIAAIQHPNVVAIADAGLVDGVPYLVMELLTGEDLEQHLRRTGPLSGRQAAGIALPLVAALAAAHDAGVIHRDLKPGNIFLARGPGGELVPKLLDFGISKFSGPSGPGNLAVTAFDQLMGSPLYLPPEALLGSRELTARSDQYSLGVVLYECITGQAPFLREDLVPLLNAISEGACAAPRTLRPDVPAALDSAILRAMSVDPARRFDHIRDLGRALLGLADARARQLWGPALGVGAGEPPEAARAIVLARPRQQREARNRSLREPRAAAQREGPRGSGGPRLWIMLGLLASGSALLAFAFGTLRAPSVVAPAAVAFVATARPAPEPEASAPLAVPAPPAALFAHPVTPEPRAAAVARPARANASSGRARPLAPRASAESDGELRKLFFPAASLERGGAERPARERAAQPAPVEARVLVNEAPLFD